MSVDHCVGIYLLIALVVWLFFTRMLWDDRPTYWRTDNRERTTTAALALIPSLLWPLLIAAFVVMGPVSRLLRSWLP